MRRLELQTTGPGGAEMDIFGHRIPIGAIEILAGDGEGTWIDLARPRASIERTALARIVAGSPDDGSDSYALRVVVRDVGDDLPATLSMLSLGPDGEPIEGLRGCRSPPWRARPGPRPR